MYPYDLACEPISNVPIVSGATAYDDPNTIITWLFIINEGLYYGDKLDHALINPNQIRFNQIDYWDNPFDRERSLSIQVHGLLDIPLHIQGTKVQFITCSPTRSEIENIPHEHRIDLTSKLEWEPTKVSLSSTNTSSPEPHFVVEDEYGDYLYSSPDSDETLLHSICPYLVT